MNNLHNEFICYRILINYNTAARDLTDIIIRMTPEGAHELEGECVHIYQSNPQ